MLTVLEVIKKTTEFLATKGIESPRLNAELLIGHALGLPRMQLYVQFERPLAEAELEKIRPLVRRRGLREPLQYITGEAHFRGLKLKADKRALIPRPETELLVEFASGACNPAPMRVLDLGTGTGAIALALAQMLPNATVTAVDRSEAALALARDNARALALEGRVSFLHSNWFEAIPHDPQFDLIVVNPPYLSADETAQTAAEVREHEPADALIAGEGGLADLRIIFAAARSRLAERGLLAVETGTGHHAELLRLGCELGYARMESRQDLTGRDRFVLAWR
jgi:release factor glutamine methyltransferase